MGFHIASKIFMIVRIHFSVVSPHKYKYVVMLHLSMYRKIVWDGIFLNPFTFSASNPNSGSVWGFFLGEDSHVKNEVWRSYALGYNGKSGLVLTKS